jgi:hypothetical protein
VCAADGCGGRHGRRSSGRRCAELFVCEEVRRERGEVVGACIGIPLAARAVVLEDDDRAAPGTRGGAGRDAVYGAVDSDAGLECAGRVPEVQREAQGLAVEALREHDVLDVVAGEVLGDERERARALRGVLRRLAVHGDDARAVCGAAAAVASRERSGGRRRQRRQSEGEHEAGGRRYTFVGGKVYRGHGHDLRLCERRGGDEAGLGTGDRDALATVAGPVLSIDER